MPVFVLVMQHLVFLLNFGSCHKSVTVFILIMLKSLRDVADEAQQFELIKLVLIGNI